MEVGCHLPVYGPAATRESTLGFARRMEALGCWTEERPAFAPRPARGSIPVWIGGHTPAAFRRVAAPGDGWHAAFATPDDLKSALPRLREACHAAGRDFATLTLSVRLGLPGRKPSAELVHELRALGELGVRHVVLESRARELAEMATTYERFAEQVRPRL
jgi:alkanesulfonate monooxygenase SsuD/methylene tetrahydromethanopterin reductase-like flavin-dependent oxidoreductase (luciferase family)